MSTDSTALSSAAEAPPAQVTPISESETALGYLKSIVDASRFYRPLVFRSMQAIVDYSDDSTLEIARREWLVAFWEEYSKECQQGIDLRFISVLPFNTFQAGVELARQALARAVRPGFLFWSNVAPIGKTLPDGSRDDRLYLAVLKNGALVLVYLNGEELSLLREQIQALLLLRRDDCKVDFRSAYELWKFAVAALRGDIESFVEEAFYGEELTDRLLTQLRIPAISGLRVGGSDNYGNLRLARIVTELSDISEASQVKIVVDGFRYPKPLRLVRSISELEHEQMGIGLSSDHLTTGEEGVRGRFIWIASKGGNASANLGSPTPGTPIELIPVE